MKINNKILPKLLDGESVGSLQYLDTAHEHGSVWAILFHNSQKDRNYKAVFRMVENSFDILAVHRYDCHVL